MLYRGLLDSLPFQVKNLVLLSRTTKNNTPSDNVLLIRVILLIVIIFVGI